MVTYGENTVETIKGDQLIVPDAVFAWQLDGKGGVDTIEENDIIDAEHPGWLHLNYTNSESANWLATTPLLPNYARDALSLIHI